MAAFTNVTIDDSSPLIVYDPPEAWTHSSGNDAQGYTNSTYHGTSVNGASAKFTFNGTGIWLYGARKRDYGGFILLVDDDVVAYANATASAAVFGQTLGGLSDLKLGQHVVSIMNGGTGPIDLDGIVYETAEPQQLGSEAIAHDSYGQINSDMTVASSQTSSAFSTQSSSQFAVHPNAMLGPSNDPNPSPSSTAITSSLSATLTGSMTDASTSFVAPKALTVNGSPDARPWSTSGAYGQSAQPSVTSNTVSITSGQAQQASSP
ncbi:hypothetical protein BD413DRAFT_585845 [Trametes elegans]|nr:hypothetical protein BD413DRAFT_585845 [Trametes elegans]